MLLLRLTSPCTSDGGRSPLPRGPLSFRSGRVRVAERVRVRVRVRVREDFATCADHVAHSSLLLFG